MSKENFLRKIKERSKELHDNPQALEEFNKDLHKIGPEAEMFREHSSVNKCRFCGSNRIEDVQNSPTVFGGHQIKSKKYCKACGRIQ